jgi:hypothetical protein
MPLSRSVRIAGEREAAVQTVSKEPSATASAA